MGADIHVMLERKVDGQWHLYERFDSVPPRAISRNAIDYKFDHYYRLNDRNYGFFAAIAGVRGDGPDPRGRPDDMSPLVKNYCDSWGHDAHSHTWLYADEFCELFLKHHMSEQEVTDFTEAQLKGAVLRGWEWVMNYYITNVPDDADPTEFRFIIFFDN